VADLAAGVVPVQHRRPGLPGKTLTRLAYTGRVPGFLLELAQGNPEG
jgi:hypothetical protein